MEKQRDDGEILNIPRKMSWGKYARVTSYCNLTDHRGLPIIHIESYRHNRHKRQEHRYGITDYIIAWGSIHT